MKTIIFIMDKQRGSTVEHRKLYTVSWDSIRNEIHTHTHTHTHIHIYTFTYICMYI